jgi:hypothetical protein
VKAARPPLRWVREDLGSVEEALHAAFQRHFHRMEDVDAVLADIDAAVDTARGRASIANRSDECS